VEECQLSLRHYVVMIVRLLFGAAVVDNTGIAHLHWRKVDDYFAAAVVAAESVLWFDFDLPRWQREQESSHLAEKSEE
jgi:hypothetical protein